MREDDRVRTAAAPATVTGEGTHKATDRIRGTGRPGDRESAAFTSASRETCQQDG